MDKRIFQLTEYREIIDNYFIPGKYDEALPRFQSLHDELDHALSAADKAILFSRMANAAADAILTQGLDQPSLVPTFWKHLADYLRTAPLALAEDPQFGGSTDEPKKRLREALELLIRFDRSRLMEEAALWTRRFAEVEEWGFKLALDVLLEKINEERMRFEREDHIENTKAMAQTYLEISESAGEEWRHARASVMNLLSDLAYFEGSEESEAEALSWLVRSLAIQPDDLFAKTRKKHIEERQTVSEQIRRFKHDTGNTKAGIEAMLKLCLRLPQASEVPLHTYLKTIQTEVRHLYGVHRFIHDEQNRLEPIDPRKIISDLILPHDGQTVHVTVTRSGSPRKWNTDPDYFRLALYNLIKNTLESFQRHHIPLAQREIRISIQFDRCVLILEDNAGGVDPELRDLIFSPYVSSKGITQGTGLGLPNARRAIEKLGGTLDFPENQPKNGTRFEIGLS